MLDDDAVTPDQSAATGEAPPSEPVNHPSGIVAQDDTASPDGAVIVPPIFTAELPADPPAVATRATEEPDPNTGIAVTDAAPDAKPDDGEGGVDALRTAIANVTGVTVPPVVPPKADDAAGDETGIDPDTKVKADNAPADADSAAPATAPAVAVPPAADAAVKTETDPAKAEPAAKTAMTAVTAGVANVDPQFAKAPDQAGNSEKAGKADADTAKPQTQAVTKPDTPATTPAPLKTDGPAQPQDQPAAKSGDRAANTEAKPQITPQAGIPAVKARADQNDKPAARHDLKPDAVSLLKTDSPQPTILLQPSAVTAPAGGNSTTAAPSPVTLPAAALPVAGIAVEIAGKALAGKNRFDIRLDPPELGRIHVRLDVDHDGRVTSHITADRSDTFDLLRRDAPALERALQDAGMKTADNGLQFSLRDHGFGRHNQPAPMRDAALVIVRDDALPAELITPVYRSPLGGRAGLDIRV